MRSELLPAKVVGIAHGRNLVPVRRELQADTISYRKFQGRSGQSLPLKGLAKQYLGRKIQSGRRHSAECVSADLSGLSCAERGNEYHAKGRLYGESCCARVSGVTAERWDCTASPFASQLSTWLSSEMTGCRCARCSI